jgi:hypothetical protein
MSRSRLRLLYVLATIFAIAFAYGAFLWGHQGLYWDAMGYFLLGEQIVQQGFLNFSHPMRTYGYPLFVAIVSTFTNQYPSMVRLAIFNAQLVVFLTVSFYGSRLFRSNSKTDKSSLAVYAALVLNPILLIYTTEVLTDLLSAVLMFLAVVFAVQTRHLNQNGEGSPSIWKSAFLSCLTAGVATMVRPADIQIFGDLAIIWLIRGVVFKDVSWRVVLALILGVVIPFIPETVSNYRAYEKINPLFVYPLYNDSLSYGLTYLKNGGVVIPGETRGVQYKNPLVPANVSSPLEFLQKAPVGFLMTAGIHVFAMFDYDFAFPFVFDEHPWYRWPISFLNYAFLFVAVGGMLIWIRQWLKKRQLDPHSLVYAGFLMGAVFYIPLYVLPAVESRHSLPEYFLFAPFFVFGLEQVRKLWIGRRWKPLGFFGIGLSIFLAVSALLSTWIQAQASFSPPGAPRALSRYVVHDLGVHFGDRIELEGYAIEPSAKIQGGGSFYLLLKWRCNGASTEPYDVQVNLVDPKGRTWVKAVHDTEDPISPCVPVPWGTGDEVDDVLSIRLPPTMPTAEYRITVGIYDNASGRYLDIRDSSGTLTTNPMQVTSLVVPKDKSSITASDLRKDYPIEQPYYFDMQEMRLLGFTQIPKEVHAASDFDVGLYWRARGKPQGDYEVAVQLRDDSNVVVFEQSARPAEGTYPTTLWNQGEVLLDWHDLILPQDVPFGDYQLAVVLREVGSKKMLGEANISKISIVR